MSKRNGRKMSRRDRDMRWARTRGTLIDIRIDELGAHRGKKLFGEPMREGVDADGNPTKRLPAFVVDDGTETSSARETAFRRTFAAHTRVIYENTWSRLLHLPIDEGLRAITDRIGWGDGRPE